MVQYVIRRCCTRSLNITASWRLHAGKQQQQQQQQQQQFQHHTAADGTQKQQKGNDDLNVCSGTSLEAWSD
jgi:hypothetical protein